jgi:tol-pal system protein YbgF
MIDMRVLVGALILLLTAPVSAIDFFSKKDDSKKSSNGSPLEQRVQMLERRINTLSTIVLRLDSLQQEIQQLRGDLEVQDHNIESLKKRQTDLYNDADQRISRLSGEAPSGMPIDASGPVTPPAASQTGYQTRAQAPEPAGEPNWESTPIQDDPNQSAASSVQQDSGNSNLPPVVSSTTRPTVDTNSPGQLQTTTVSVAPRPSTPYRVSKEEKSSYQSAFNLLMDKQVDQAKNAFRSFLKKYPRSGLAGNAQYWLAQANYVARDFDVALTEFNKVLSEHPGSDKVSDAMLKIGYIQSEKKQWSAAKETLNKVVNRYPNTPSSQKAKTHLSKIRAKGH